MFRCPLPEMTGWAAIWSTVFPCSLETSSSHKLNYNTQIKLCQSSARTKLTYIHHWRNGAAPAQAKLCVCYFIFYLFFVLVLIVTSCVQMYSANAQKYCKNYKLSVWLKSNQLSIPLEAKPSAAGASNDSSRREQTVRATAVWIIVNSANERFLLLRKRNNGCYTILYNCKPRGINCH